jgi:hypothetical protein
MKADMIAWLAGAGSWAFHTALSLFLVLNAIAIAVVVARRDRSLVDRWTPRWLAANLGLLALGGGVPLLTALLRAGVSLLPSASQATATLPK